MPNEIQDEVIELYHDCNCKDSFGASIHFEDFGSQKTVSYPRTQETALRIWHSS